MQLTERARAVSLVVGLALFVALGLTVMNAGNSGAERALAPGPITAAGVAPAEQLSNAFAMVAAHICPSVVSVFSEKMIKVTEPEFPFDGDLFRRFFGDQTPFPHEQQQEPRERKVPQRGLGSGMILDKEGHVLTNFHVVDNVDEVKVQLADGRTFEAQVVGTDPRTDVAVIKMKGSIPGDLPAIAFGDSGALRVGELVMAIGAPFGLTQTVTNGIISARGRSDVGLADYEDFLQTDAPINPGNSGGPLCNMDGQVIGMNSAIASSVGQFAGVGFSIPSNMIKTMLPKLIKGEKITRGRLGVVIQAITKDLAKHFGLSDTKGALVSQITKDSPAEKAGMKTGDVIVRYNDNPIEDVRSLRNMVAATEPGTKVKIEVIRNGKQETLTAVIEKLQGEGTLAAERGTEGEGVLGKLGLSAQTLTPEVAKELEVDAQKGVVITDVEGGGLASLAGLEKGDVIVEANRQAVGNVDELERVLEGAKDSALLLIKRQHNTIFVVLQLKS